MKNIFLLIFILIFLYIICNEHIEKFSVGGSDINISEKLTLSYIDKCDPSNCDKYNNNQMKCMMENCSLDMSVENLLKCYSGCNNNCTNKSPVPGPAVMCNPSMKPPQMCPDKFGRSRKPCPPCGKPACNCNSTEYGPCITDDNCNSHECRDNLCIRSIPMPNGSSCRDDIECNSGLCMGNRCSELKSVGGRCTDDRECVSNNCEHEGEDEEYNIEKVCRNKKCKDGKDCPDDTLCWVTYNSYSLDQEIEGRCDSSKTCKTLEGIHPSQCPYNLTKCTWDASTGECRNI